MKFRRSSTVFQCYSSINNATIKEHRASPSDDLIKVRHCHIESTFSKARHVVPRQQWTGGIFFTLNNSSPWFRHDCIARTCQRVDQCRLPAARAARNHEQMLMPLGHKKLCGSMSNATRTLPRGLGAALIMDEM